MLKTRRGLFVRVLAHAALLLPVLAQGVVAFAVLTPTVLAHTLSAFVALPLSATTQTVSPDSAAATGLLIKGAVKQELRLTLNDLKSMPRTKVTAKGHDGSTHEYEGVTLASLLTKAGAPQAGDLRGKSMSLCVVAEGSDGYRAAFSLAELDLDFANESVLVADTADGKDLGPDQGPLRLVVPGDKAPKPLGPPPQVSLHRKRWTVETHRARGAKAGLQTSSFLPGHEKTALSSLA